MMSIPTFGQVTLMPHFNTIAGALPTRSVRHLFAMCFLAKTTLRRLNLFFPLIVSLILYKDSVILKNQ